LSRRLTMVQQRLEELLAEAPAVRRVLSLCSGDGRDILPVVARLPIDHRPDVALVELDADLATAAERRAADLGVAATVIGDAGSSSTWQQFMPVDLLLLCGIFGNIPDDDIRNTIDAARAMVASDGYVIWTRGYFSDVDLRPQVRQWFAETGFLEVTFDAEPTGFGVGVNRLPSAGRTARVPSQLFSFAR
jgi:hypothetical protein